MNKRKLINAGVINFISCIVFLYIGFISFSWVLSLIAAVLFFINGLLYFYRALKKNKDVENI